MSSRPGRYCLVPACVRVHFSTADERLAAIFYRRGVTLMHLQRAIWLGRAREYVALLNGTEHTPMLVTSLVREGMVADLVIFDPARMEDKATAAKPHQYSKGYEYVFVNGKIAIDEGQMTTVPGGVGIRGNAGRLARMPVPRQNLPMAYKRKASILLVASAVVVVAQPARAQQQALASLQAEMHSKLEEQLARAADHMHGVMGFAIKDLTSGEAFYRNADLVFPTASSIKLTVLLELERQDQKGKLSLSERHTIRHSELPAGDTDPILHMLGDGTATMTLRDIATFMVVLSDNGATNILIDGAGMDNINAEIARVGLKETHLRRKMIDIDAARAGRENVSTPRELSGLLEIIHSGRALDPAHTKDYLDLISQPKDSLFNRALPPAVRIEDKPGSLDAVRCDAGIIEIPGRPFVMTVMTTYLDNNDDGERAVKDVARAVYDYFVRLGASSTYGRMISEK
jgi:beta-lactamase class A